MGGQCLVSDFFLTFVAFNRNLAAANFSSRHVLKVCLFRVMMMMATPHRSTLKTFPEYSA